MYLCDNPILIHRPISGHVGFYCTLSEWFLNLLSKYALIDELAAKVWLYNRFKQH